MGNAEAALFVLYCWTPFLTCLALYLGGWLR